MMVAMLALVLVVAVPAIAAQRDGNWRGNGNWGGNGNWDGNGGGGIVQAPTETFVSGTNQNTGGAVNSTGDNSNTCAAQQNFNNSGGVLNQQSFQQYASRSGGIVALGPSFTNNPQQSVPCEQTVQQSASSSSY